MRVVTKAFMGAMALTIFAGAADAAPVARMRSCDEEHDLVAQRSTQATTIVFRNRSGEVRKLFWLNFDGDRVAYSTLQPGERVEQPTYSGHPWVATNRRGQCIAIFVPTGRDGRIDLD
jgi:hypothetical protein